MEVIELLMLSISAAFKAGEAIEEIYHKEFSIEYKEDKSPLTEADKSAHQIITEFLSNTPYPILSEEGNNIEYEIRRDWSFFWMVDPLDGTKEFIKKNGEFTVNIALIKNGLPLLGVVYAPILKKTYFAARGYGSYMFEGKIPSDNFIDLIQKSNRLPINELNGQYFVVASRSHLNKETESFINNLKKTHKNISYKTIGSSLKLCIIAEGNAHIYPRMAPTMEWDTAAAHAVLKYAGGNVWQYESGIEMTYNKPELLNPWFVAEKR
jgi:3'(2'), 5'-bisphosphate nucleotidase